MAEIYKEIDAQINNHRESAGVCIACGKCCDFESFDHKLFVTPPELIFLAANLHGENLKPMKTGRCPYQIDNKCTIYKFRFAGCRIFSCKGDTDFQSGLSERTLKKFKAICEQFQIPYRYADLATALNSFETA
ncbi:MAG: YkgJ family cysteine cluster protein [Phycisphaerae bacterium]|nr:YkgJ family cysteine cluster protein [Phycisphaerae bacterium]